MLLLDGNLAVSRIVLDSVVSTGERYGPIAAPLIAAPGDSSLFVDRDSRAWLVIDPSGKVVRTTAAPVQQQDFRCLWASRSGTDANGDII